jgi:F-type H+/Na+-transporting ATPase subunit alpha
MSEINPSEIAQLLEEKLEKFPLTNEFNQVGKVLKVGDGIVHIYGMREAFYGEMLEFTSGTRAIVLNLEEDHISAVLLGSYSGVAQGDLVKRTYKKASIEIAESMLSRVVNVMGKPIDGKGSLKGPFFEVPLERKAPGVIFREPVNDPLQTGIKAIDSMIPIGKGQRELIIGDRQTGKTAISIDTILNQKEFYENGNPIYCIYVAIGQKASTVASIVNNLEAHGALDYTIIVAANASDPTSERVYAPFAGAAIGEYFRDSGRHALIIYDDLSKQAVAYREISLLLRRPPGREAYPGDVFYLHSRLLERAAKIIKDDTLACQMNDLPDSLKNKVKGGGSLTALPIIETQGGDVSAYIPTNVISITDGQIFLETNLFNAGIKPAINEGISVSRVGGAAQIKSMKKIAGRLKIDQAQYRELESFAFGSDLEPTTAAVIEKGRRNVELLKQSVNSPYKVEEQIAAIYLGTHNLLKKIPLTKIKEFEKKYLDHLKFEYKETLQELKKGNLDENITGILEKVALEIQEKYNFN